MAESKRREAKEVDDIEEIALATRSVSDLKYNNKVLPRSLRRRGCKEEPQCDSFIPGTQSVYIKTWGCTHNTSDGEYMAGLLASSGYSVLGIIIKANKSVGVVNYTKPHPVCKSEQLFL